MSADLQTRLIKAFQDHFQAMPPYIVRAPGRVNLIGEHTDYNDGFVMPVAIDRATWIAFTPRSDKVVRVKALDFDQFIEFNLDNLQKGHEGPAEYIKGVAWALQEAGYTLNGWEGVIQGDIPIGAGLSSSAALELAVARTFNTLSQTKWQPIEMAKLSQKAENQWVGVKCGIMDQLISSAGQVGHALMIDCRSLNTEPVPIPDGVAIVVLDTSTRRGLVDVAYNERRQQCEEAANYFGAKALRDVTLAQLEAAQAKLNPIVWQRAKHVITENKRVEEARDALYNHNLTLFGQLINQSHISLRDDFAVSSVSLNQIVECSQAQNGVYGARMTGAGFGGCAIALVQQSHVSQFVASVTTCYEATSGLKPQIYVCQATNGAEVVFEAKTG